MEKITVDKDDLLAKVKSNREKHREIFLEALEGYRADALDVLDRQVRDLRDGKTPRIQIILDRPEDHTRDYDRVISMLEMHKSDEFVLTETDFAQYALDDWSWKRQWALSNSGYVSAGTRKAHTDYFEG